MSIYRQYEDPYKIQELLDEARRRFAEDPFNEYLALDVASLEERLNHAWQDDEYDSDDEY